MYLVINEKSAFTAFAAICHILQWCRFLVTWRRIINLRASAWFFTRNFLQWNLANQVLLNEWEYLFIKSWRIACSNYLMSNKYSNRKRMITFSFVNRFFIFGIDESDDILHFTQISCWCQLQNLFDTLLHQHLKTVSKNTNLSGYLVLWNKILHDNLQQLFFVVARKIHVEGHGSWTQMCHRWIPIFPSYEDNAQIHWLW